MYINLILIFLRSQEETKNKRILDEKIMYTLKSLFFFLFFFLEFKSMASAHDS